MLIGFLNPAGGEATIEGLDIAEDMKTLYTMMGVCLSMTCCGNL